MTPPSRPVHGVERHLDVRVPVSDGLELSANLWLPVSPGAPAAGAPAADAAGHAAPAAGAAGDAAGAHRHPAILEMIPYRKDDWRANADESRGRWFARRGYAFCRLDVRGTGSSGSRWAPPRR